MKGPPSDGGRSGRGRVGGVCFKKPFNMIETLDDDVTRLLGAMTLLFSREECVCFFGQGKRIQVFGLRTNWAMCVLCCVVDQQLNKDIYLYVNGDSVEIYALRSNCTSHNIRITRTRHHMLN